MELNNNSAEQQFAKFEFIQKTSHSCTISSNFVRHLFLRLSSQAFLLRPLAPVPRAPCACINLKLQEPHPSPAAGDRSGIWLFEYSHPSGQKWSTNVPPWGRIGWSNASPGPRPVASCSKLYKMLKQATGTMILLVSHTHTRFWRQQFRRRFMRHSLLRTLFQPGVNIFYPCLPIGCSGSSSFGFL